MSLEGDLEIVLRRLRMCAASRKFEGGYTIFNGICANIRPVIRAKTHENQPYDVRCELIREYYKIVDRLFRSWPEYCGNITYPVDGPLEYNESRDLWANPKRLRLLDYMINTLARERYERNR